MQWDSLVRSLMDDGLTQVQIAERVGCGQSTLSEILNRRSEQPRANLALALLALREETNRAKSKFAGTSFAEVA